MKILSVGARRDPSNPNRRSEIRVSRGKLVFLFLDLNIITATKLAVEIFTQSKDKLNVLWNNAGVMFPGKGPITIQGDEMHLGANTIAHF